MNKEKDGLLFVVGKGYLVCILDIARRREIKFFGFKQTCSTILIERFQLRIRVGYWTDSRI